VKPLETTKAVGDRRGHAGLKAKIGDIDFGKEFRARHRCPTLRWYDHVLKGIDNGIEKGKAGKDFRDGQKCLAEEDTCPGARPANPLLSALRRQSEHLSGRRDLEQFPALAEIPDKYVYNPA